MTELPFFRRWSPSTRLSRLHFSSREASIGDPTFAHVPPRFRSVVSANVSRWKRYGLSTDLHLLYAVEKAFRSLERSSWRMIHNRMCSRPSKSRLGRSL